MKRDKKTVSRLLATALLCSLLFSECSLRPAGSVTPSAGGQETMPEDRLFRCIAPSRVQIYKSRIRYWQDLRRPAS